MSSINSNLPKNIKRYRKKNFPFNLSDNLKCLICSQLLLNALQTECGCRYCQICLDKYMAAGNKKCLTEGCGDIINTMSDNAVNREIGKLKVKCLFSECKYEGLLKDIGDHLDNCVHQIVSCSECAEELPKNDLKEHLVKKCQMRLVNCEKCGELMAYKELDKSHFNPNNENICPKLEGDCPYKCDMKNVNLLNHRKYCSKKPVTCPFSVVGCNKVMTEENLNSHNKEESVQHSTLLMKEITTIKSDISELKQKYSEFESLKREFSNFKVEILDKIKTLEKIPRQISPSTNSIRSTEEKTIYRNGTFIWKIERFSELRSDAERGNRISVTSDHFYTKEFGYKMSMKIYPAGDGVGKGTHLSVFFTLMKGEYDDLLQWPFKNKVTLTILDQKNKTNDHSDTFKPDVRSTCYQQPTDEYNIASGSPKFIAFPQLDDLYLKNDVIFLKITVLNN